MEPNRRDFLGRSGLAGAATMMGLSGAAVGQDQAADREDAARRSAARRPIGVSTYSFWQFRGERLGIEACIDKAADMGFDGVEVLHVQMQDESNAALQKIKRRAHSLGLPLMGFSSHQGFVTPDADLRRTNIQKTLYQIDLAYRLGIPTMRIKTGRWGTIKSFDDFMAKKGIEPTLEGHTDEEAFGWVIGSIEKLLPHAEACGVVLGLEKHWGLGRTAQGVLRIVEVIKSPWLRMTLDTGNFLERSYEQMGAMAASPVGVELVQAKTYFGGGRWYERVGPGLRPDRRDPPAARLSGLGLAGVRGQRGRRDRGAPEPGAAEETFLVKGPSVPGPPEPLHIVAPREVARP